MTNLSPAAQTILDAWENEWSKANLCHDQHSIAAVLRAAADQVVPEQALEDVPGRFVNACCHEQRQRTRRQLLAIAAELEQLND